MEQRAPAPPYRGEGPFALWHVSEDPTLRVFAPHRARTALTDELLVWAVDTRHLPLFWFPRQCPRCTFWAGPHTGDDDVSRFLGGRRDARMHVIEDSWLDRVRGTQLYLYRLPEATFRESAEVAGYWTSSETVEPVERVSIDGLIERHAEAGIELRTAANLWPLWDAVVRSTIAYSGLRLRNASPRPMPLEGKP
jgi:hypothetical protein